MATKRKPVVAEVLGQRWSCTLLSNEQYEAKHGRKCVAVTLMAERQIEFRADAFTLGTVRHELMHAYFASMPITSAGLGPEQIEEVAAEIVDTHWDTLSATAKQIYKALRP
jgi:hypothetical protein